MGESSLLGPDLIYKTLEKILVIWNRLITAYSRKKSYDNHRRKDLKYQESDKVDLKISTMKGVFIFVHKGKFSHRYVGPNEILKNITIM